MKYIVIFLFVYLSAALGLRCYPWGFSSFGEWELLSNCSARASHHRVLSCCTGSVAAACGLNSSSSGSRAWAQYLCHRSLVSCGTWSLPEPGIKPMSPALEGGLLNISPPGESYSTLESFNHCLLLVFFSFFLSI